MNDNDTVTRGDGADRLRGQVGHDILQGDDGADTLEGGTAADTPDGGLGTDNLYDKTATSQSHTDGSADSLNGGLGNDLLDGDDSSPEFDTCLGGGGTDTINC